ncbi:hypothetical protein GGI43DRAFT_432850 [Trichoderma evansii]
MDILELEHDTTEMRNLLQLATKDDIFNMLNTTDFFLSKTAAERDHIIQDTDGALSEIITEAVCTTLNAILPRIDQDKGLNTSRDLNKMQQSSITESEEKKLQTLLKSQVCWVQFDASKQTVSSQYRQDILQPVIELGSFTNCDKTDEHILFNSIVDLEKLKTARMQLGENLPPNQDLTSICNLRDANRLAELLGGPLRTAILHSECGTGKTFVTLLALKFLIEERIHKFANDTLHIESDDRVFKPSVIFMPSAMLRQYFAKISYCWMGIFDIWLLCEASDNFRDLDQKLNIIDNIEDFQKKVDHWAIDHKNSNTARIILLTSYEAGVMLMLDPETSRPQSSQKIQGLTAQKQYNTSNVALEGASIKFSSEKSDENGRGDNETGFYHRCNSKQDTIAQNSRERMVVQNSMWNAVVLGECQFIKKETTSYHKLAKQLDRDALLLVSSNPLTSLQDLYGYLRVIWYTAWPFSYSLEPDSTLRTTLYHPTTYENLLKRESVHGVTLTRVVAGGEIMTDKLTPRQRQRCEEYIRGWHTIGCEVSTIAPAIQRILGMVSVRRGLFTPMKLPNDDITYVGKGVSGLSIRTIELTPKDTDSIRKKLDNHISQLLKYPEDLYVEVGAVENMLDSAICRRLSTISTDINNVKLTTPTKGLLNILSTIPGNSIPLTSTRGSGDINRPATFDATGGLEWLFYLTRDSQRYSFPIGRLDQVRYAAWDSSKYCYVLMRALEAKERDEKLLVCVNNPLTSQIIYALLVTCGIKTLHCTSKHSQSERKQAASAFGNRLSLNTCLVTSMQLSASEGSFCRSCHRGIIVELPTNHSALLNTIGRLWRIGQKRHVEWEILTARYSFDAFIEGSIMKEYSTVVAATANIDAAITGEARMICAYEIIKQQLGQEYSRYPRMRAPWNEMDGDDMCYEGYFYSALADFFFQNPDQAFLVGRYNIRQIALAWKIGVKITTAMVKQPVPLEAGEGLALKYL